MINFLADFSVFCQRTLSTTIQQATNHFPVLLLTGPRQVGKTTLLNQARAEDRRIVTLDDFDLRLLAQTDPQLFLQTYYPPILIDEAQYAPQLFSAIKMIIDQDPKPGLFWLTGSQKFHLMAGVSESLAGRVAILDLLGLSQAESQNHPRIEPFLPTPQWIENTRRRCPPPVSILDLYSTIWRGSFPKIMLEPETPRDIFYNSYIQTYIQRDVRALARVGDEMTFARFLRTAAARTGQLINWTDLARDVGVDVKTIQAWTTLLETSGLIFFLYPFSTNITNRLIKTPKLYFLDTGLCSYLTQWSSPQALEAGALSGAILETYVFSEILKSYWHNGKKAQFYFYRDRDQKEIDLLIEEDGQLYPIEIKKSINLGHQVTKSFSALSSLGCPIGPGAVLCLKEIDVPLTREITAIPIRYL